MSVPQEPSLSDAADDPDSPPRRAKPAWDGPAPPRRQQERELGVPIPGEIVEQSRWANTALKRFPPPGEPLDWSALFGRGGPVMLDLGCGNGRSTLLSAVLRPEFNHLGVDTLPVVIRYATRRANQRGLKHVRFGVLGARELLSEHVLPGSVREIHCYHPQPYSNPARIGKRLITPDFLQLVHRSLEPGGRFVIQTDHPAYWEYIRSACPAFFEFTEQPGCWPDSPKGRTRREILALKRGLPVFRGWGIPKSALSLDEARQIVESLPLPTFNADRSLCELDRLERE
jgi:tRNA (guanine-N7-)-methyltransferase